MGAFDYVFSEEAKDDCVITCIEIVLPMVWVESPKHFYAISETLTDMVNALLHKSLPVRAYRSIYATPETGPGPTYTLDSLTHIYCYMDDVITAV